MINVLVSYHYMTDVMLEIVKATQGSIRWLLDSGAFSAHSLNKPIKVEDYNDWLKQYKHLFWQYIALDAIGDVEKTKENLESSVAAGHKPMPVVVSNVNVNKAFEMSKVSGHLCLAGGVFESMEHYAPRLAELRRVVGDDVWIHGLGFGRGMKVCGTQVNSVDVSSWTGGKRFGHFSWFEGSKGVRNKNWREALKTPFSELPSGMKKAIMQSGLSKKDLSNPAIQAGGFSMLGMQTTHAYIQYAAALEQRKIRFFFATSGTSDLNQLLIAAKHSKRSGISWKDFHSESLQYKKLSDMSELKKLATEAAENVNKTWEIK
jgi:hypothetical protein